MKDEIKEILEELENMYEISELEEQVNNINKIRDYITNLQQENERLKEEYKNKLDKTLEVLQYELQFQTGGCYHRLSNLFDYLQNGSDSE